MYWSEKVGIDSSHVLADTFHPSLMEWTFNSPTLLPSFDGAADLDDFIIENGFSGVGDQTFTGTEPTASEFILAQPAAALDGNGSGALCSSGFSERNPSRHDLVDLENDVTPNHPVVNRPTSWTRAVYPNNSKAENDNTLSGSQGVSDPKLTLLSLTKQLAELSISLVEHTATIPPESIHQTGLLTRHPDTTSETAFDDSNVHSTTLSSPVLINNARKPVPRFSMPHTFQLTQDLIDIYREFVDFITRSETFRSITTSIFNTNKDTLGRSSAASRDDATVLILFSCHHRVIDMWHRIMGHILLIPVHLLGKHCAKFRIGSYVPSSSLTTMPLEMIMCSELATQLVDSIRELTDALITYSSLSKHPHCSVTSTDEELKSACDDRSNEAVTTATNMAGHALLNRASGMFAHINHVRKTISQRQREHAKKTGL